MNIGKNINYIVRSGNSLKNQCILQIRQLNLWSENSCEKICVPKTRETSIELLRTRRNLNKYQGTLHQTAFIEMPRAKATPRSISKAVALQNGAAKTMDGIDEGAEIVSSTTNGNSGNSEIVANAANLVVTAKVTKGRGRAKKVTEAAVEVQSPAAVADAVITGRGRKKAIVATIENGDGTGAETAKLVMQIKVPKPRGRGKKDASKSNVEEAVIVEKPIAKGREKKTAVNVDASLQNLDNDKNVAEEIPAVKVKTELVTKSLARGRKKKEQPAAITDPLAIVETEEMPQAAVKEENAVSPKKRATTKKIKSEPLTQSQVDLQALHEPVVAEEVQHSSPVVSPKKLKKGKPLKVEKPKKEKVTAKKTKSKKQADTIEENTSAVKPTSRSRKRAVPTDTEATEEVSVNTIQEGGNTVAVKFQYSSEIKAELQDDLQEEEKSPKKKRGKSAKVVDQPAVEKAEKKAETKAEKKPAAQRGRKRAAATANVASIIEDDAVEGAKPSKSKKVAAINSTETTYNKADFELAPSENSTGTASNVMDKRYNLKISSWNVAGLRSWCKKDGLKFLDYEEPDIFCMQEIKCTTDQLPEEAARLPGYHPYWLCMAGGYAGVAIYSKIMPINVEYGLGNQEFDEVGRIITAEYEKFFLICVYVPNSGRKLVNLEPRMRWEQLFQSYVKKLDARKPVVICGDMNVSHTEIDLANPKTNTRNAGFTQEERDKMSELLALGYVDTFRHLYPTRTGAYTFWTYMSNARARNVGWRLDYFLVSQRFTKRVVDSCIRSQCKGSDHCPITLFLKL